MNINPNEVITERLAYSFGLQQYAFIIQQLMKVDVSLDSIFQKTFNGFYHLRRNTGWRRYYFELFEKCKSETVSFTKTITYIYEKTGKVEPSFSSKMCATIDTDKPIWDQYVLSNLGLHLNGKKEERINKAIELYKEIEQWYKSYLDTPDAKNCITVFDKFFPTYKWISNTKKIDYFLWGTRKDRL